MKLGLGAARGCFGTIEAVVSGMFRGACRPKRAVGGSDSADLWGASEDQNGVPVSKGGSGERGRRRVRSSGDAWMGQFQGGEGRGAWAGLHFICITETA